MEGIEGKRPLRVGKIRRNPATIALAKFLPTSSRVRTGFNGLSCSRSGRSEKRPSMIHDCAFFGYFFFKFLAPTLRIPLFNGARTRTSSRVRTGLSGLPCSRALRSVRKAARHDSRFRFLRIFFQIFSPLRTDSPFQMRATRTPTSSRVRMGLSGLTCSRSGRSEKRPSMIHVCAFFGYFFSYF